MKKLSFILCISLLTLAFTGCSKAGENTTKEPAVVVSTDTDEASEQDTVSEDSLADEDATCGMIDQETVDELDAYLAQQERDLNPETAFYQEPLSDELKDYITGASYPDLPADQLAISYDDLVYLHLLHYDFEGNVQEGEMICNVKIADDLLEIFRALYDAQYEIDKIRLIDEYGADDDLSCADNNTSCFNYRVVAGSTHLSNHAYGMAIDINPFQNPYITYPGGVERISPVGSEPYADRNSGLEHMILRGDLCYQLFTEHGFFWGGNYKSMKDYQHFEMK